MLSTKAAKQLYEGDDSSCSESELEPETAIDDLDVALNKVSLVSEMFLVNREEVMLLLSLLHGNMQKPISVCLKGLNLHGYSPSCIQVCKNANKS